MTRHFILIAVLLGLALPSQAKSYRIIPLHELVARADVIVVGTVAAAGAECRVKVDQALTDGIGPEVTFPRSADTVLRVGETRVLFLVSGKEIMSLVYPLAHKDADRADEVRRLLDMKAAPGRYLDDPEISASPAYLGMLGWVFEKEDRVGKLAKSVAIEHLRKSLTSGDNQVVLQAVAGLGRTGSNEAAVAVIPLLRHSDEQIRLDAVRFLELSSPLDRGEPVARRI